MPVAPPDPPRTSPPDAPPSAAPAPAPTPWLAPGAGQVFDVCHVGVVLRAVLLVHGALALGVMFGATGLADWLVQLAVVSSVALPCMLLWLLAGCALRRPLSALSRAGQWAAAGMLGALCAGLGWSAGHYSGLQPLADQPLMASLCTGAGLGVALTGWLQLRAERLDPAHTAARLAELQSRIRPHFLFNTLNAALSLVRADPPRAEQVLEDLAELFRHALDDVRDCVTLAEEVVLAERYLAIEQIRFGARLRVSWQLDPAADAARLPPLLLQPLVENAVRHGVEPGVDGGTVHIETAVRRGLAWITVTNSTPAASASTPGRGMALGNVRERLHLMHDVAARFDVQREAGQFRVRLGVPL
jgi:two-component system sensor histidine kinase AlgZ